MIRDNETGNIEYINYEAYEELQEELEKAKELICTLTEDNIDLKIELEKLKKDSNAATHESKRI